MEAFFMGRSSERRGFAEERIEVKEAGVHGELAGGVAGPLLGCAVTIQLDAVAVGIAKVERFAHAVVGRALELKASGPDASEGVGERGAGGVEDGDVEESRRARRGWLAAPALPGIQADVVVIAARGDKGSVGSEALHELESEDATVEAEGALEIGDLEVHVPDANVGIDVGHVWIVLGAAPRSGARRGRVPLNMPRLSERTRLKVCCIASIEEARLAIGCGADALGLVARMPSGPGPIADSAIAEIVACVPPPIATFLLTSEVDAEAVVDHVRRTGVNTVQLVDDSTGAEVYGALRAEVPSVRIVQVIHVRERESVELAQSAAERVDALLLDSGNPKAAIRELGGTGRTHDWSLSRTIVERSRVPVFLAGGITPANVGAALAEVRPFGIDLCSGVRTNGRLDEGKLRSLTTAMWG